MFLYQWKKLNETITAISRTGHQQSIVTVQLKKQKGMRKPAMQERMDPEKTTCSIRNIQKVRK